MTDDLELQDYLDATSDASKRTRTVSITVVVASIIVFAGLLNSLQSSWLRERLRASNNLYSPYVVSKIGEPPADKTLTSLAAKQYELRYQEFYSALVKTYVDSSYVIRVPFFGFRVDVNDLGVLGGISFVVILAMLRFCISREVENLKTYFLAAERCNRLKEFYTLLAMCQVFTIPASRTIKRDWFLIWAPKVFCFLPVVVHTTVMVHDFITAGVGQALSNGHTQILFACELLLFFGVAGLTNMVVKRLRRVDALWDLHWRQIGAPSHEAVGD